MTHIQTEHIDKYSDNDLFSIALEYIRDYKTTITPADQLYPIINTLFEESRCRSHKPRCTRRNVLISDILDLYSQYLYQLTNGNLDKAYTVQGLFESYIDKFNRSYTI